MVNTTNEMNDDVFYLKPSKNVQRDQNDDRNLDVNTSTDDIQDEQNFQTKLELDSDDSDEMPDIGPKHMRTFSSQQDIIEKPKLTILMNDRRGNRQIRKPISNYIRTTKYTLLTFIPINLFEQFMRVSNIYFLLIVVISLIPGISPWQPETTWVPLLVILGISSLKDAIEDFVWFYLFY